MTELLSTIGATFSLTWEGTALGIALITAVIAGLVKISRSVQDIRNRVDAVGPDGHVVTGLVEGQARIEGTLKQLLTEVRGVSEKATTTNDVLAAHTQSDAENFHSIDSALLSIKDDIGTITRRTPR